MKRLTINTKYGWQLKGNIQVYGDVGLYNNAIDKLAAFEDIELMPEEIKALKTENEQLKKQKHEAEPRALSLMELFENSRRPVWARSKTGDQIGYCLVSGEDENGMYDSDGLFWSFLLLNKDFACFDSPPKMEER